MVHRADFLDLLVTKALNLGVTVRVGATVTSFDFETPAVELSNGERFHADAIFGADGLRSRCREALLGHPDPPYDTGEMAYRVTAKVDKIKQNKETASLTAGSDIQCWMGPNAHAVGYPLKKGNMFNIFFSSPNDLSSEVNVVKADMEELRTKLKSWDPRLIQLVNLADSALKWRLQNSHGTETWCHASGKAALLGDACHASLPYLQDPPFFSFFFSSILSSQLPLLTLSFHQRPRRRNGRRRRRRARPSIQ